MCVPWKWRFPEFEPWKQLGDWSSLGSQVLSTRGGLFIDAVSQVPLYSLVPGNFVPSTSFTNVSFTVSPTRAGKVGPGAGTPGTLGHTFFAGSTLSPI